MGKIVGRWIVYEYRDGEFVHLSKPLPTKEQAERERAKLVSAAGKRNSMGVGFIHTEK